MSAHDVVDDRGIEPPAIVQADDHRAAFHQEFVEAGLELDQPIAAGLRPQRPCHFSGDPQAGVAVGERLPLLPAQEFEHDVRVELAPQEKRLRLVEEPQRPVASLARDVDPGRGERLDDLFRRAVVGDEEATLATSQPVFDEGDDDGQSLRRVLVDGAEVFARIQIGQLLFQFGCHDAASRVRPRGPRAVTFRWTLKPRRTSASFRTPDTREPPASERPATSIVAGFVDGRSKRRVEPLAEAVPHY